MEKPICDVCGNTQDVDEVTGLCQVCMMEYERPTRSMEEHEDDD